MSIQIDVNSILGPDPQKLEVLLGELVVNDEFDPELRTLLYLTIINDIDMFLLKLCSVLRLSRRSEPRIRAVRLLAELVLADTPHFHWDMLRPDTQEHLKYRLLELLGYEQDPQMWRPLEAVVFGIARGSGRPWPLFINFLISGISSGSDRISGYGLFLIDEYPVAIRDYMLNGRPDLLLYIRHSVSNILDYASVKTRSYAIKAVLRFMSHLDAQTGFEEFDSLAGFYVRKLVDVILLSTEEEASTKDNATKALVFLLQSKPVYLRKNPNRVVTVLTYVVKIAQKSDLDPTTRRTAIKLMIDVLDAQSGEPVWVAIRSQHVKRLCLVLLEMLSQGYVAPVWSENEGEDAPGNQIEDVLLPNHEFAKPELAKLIATAGPIIVYTNMQPHLRQYFNDSAWQKKLASMIAVTQLLGGSSEQLISCLPTLISMTGRLLIDPRPQVRWEAASSVFRLTDKLGELGLFETMEPHLRIILSALTAKMADDSSPRVRARMQAAYDYINIQVKIACLRL